MAEWALPQINLELCNHCGTCVEQCPGHAVEMSAEGPLFVQPFNCTYCALCEDVCPRGAISCTYAIVWDPCGKTTISTPSSQRTRRASS
jgi:formate hydrogenlyase subunit 6/NADH:ubiquinone oxidoreductase subunit I